MSPLSNWQVMAACHIVSPQEYDHAALHHPHRCPLVLMGDHRSGQQLIDSAARTQDFQQRMQSLAGSAEGLARLDSLATHLEQQLQAIESVLVCGR
jgi:hypothetical protein